MRFLLLLLLLLPIFAPAQTPAAANKQLFDRTIDELNFRTFETVYDKHFTRQKFPATLRTAAARRQFTNFDNNAELQKLFLNYNDAAERYKTRFGSGPLTLAEFEKQLSGVLRDRNFEFFIRGLPRDEKAALIRTEQRAIKQATAQFNASGNPAALPGTPQPEEPLATPAPLTTNGPAPGDDPTPAPVAEPGPRPAGEAATSPTPPASAGPGWVAYLTLLLSLGTFGGLVLVVASLLPELRRLRRRVRTLEAEAYYHPEADAPAAAPTPPAAPEAGFFDRFRAQTTGELPADQYEDEDAG